MSLLKPILKFFYDFIELIVIIVTLFVLVYKFVYQPFEIKGASMEPYFSDKEFVIADKLSYKFNGLKRGDVVIIKAPYNHDQDYIKRVVGLPGETVTIVEGKVYINFKPLNEPYLRDITTIYPGKFMRETVDIEIPKDHYFIMGDNRPYSFDGRGFGPIHIKLLVGKAVFRAWPPGKLGAMPDVIY